MCNSNTHFLYVSSPVLDISSTSCSSNFSTVTFTSAAITVFHLRYTSCLFQNRITTQGTLRFSTLFCLLTKTALGTRLNGIRVRYSPPQRLWVKKNWGGKQGERRRKKYEKRRKPLPDTTPKTHVIRGVNFFNFQPAGLGSLRATSSPSLFLTLVVTVSPVWLI